MRLRDKEYPSKQTVNLAVSGKSLENSGYMVPVLVMYLLFLVIFVRFGVIGPVMGMTNAREGLKQKEEELAKIQDYNADYFQVENQYEQYFCMYLTQEERTLPNRVQVIRLLEESVKNRGAIETITIEGNRCQLVVTQMPLSGISELAKELESSPLVEQVAVSTAVVTQYEPQADKAQTMRADMTITLTEGAQLNE